MADQSLVVRQETAVGQVMPQTSGIEGFDDYDASEDLKIPVLKIVQGTSKMEGANRHGGDFYNTITGEFAESLTVVPLALDRQRAKFNKGDDKPDCVSRDCVNGSKYGQCDSCEYNADYNQSLWEKDINGERPPHCDKGYRLLLINTEDGGPAIFTASKTNVNPVKTLVTMLKTVGLKKTRTSALWSGAYVFKTELREEPGRKWYQLVIRPAKWHAPEEIAEYRDMAGAMKSTKYEVVGDEHSDAIDGEAVDPDAPIYAGPDYRDAPPPPEPPKSVLF
jgi:hypothetical protein